MIIVTTIMIIKMITMIIMIQIKKKNTKNFDKTTNLYKELTDSNIDQDVLFKALMLYARENNKGVYDRYNRSSQHRHDDELRD